MWRFYLIATALVVAIGSIVVAHRFAVTAWRPRAQTPHRAPPASGNGNAGFVVTPPPFFDGQGGWVLSALPACFDQLSATEGPAALMRGRVPPARERVPPGTTLRAGNCSVYVRPHDVWVFRGRDRLRVPPDAGLFRTAAGLTLLYAHADRVDVRVYHAAPAPPQSP